ncbi:shikimate kinase [Jeotgalicoccus coquinae]|uniref:Shikimate kinase n=1 Tax=Jeotgalicoccus coquinae TaxID=709509 RepID=A0A6V7RAH5_9STAP|nr:shikimate kinase [Jeotgalicoccus coquinae]MBB6422883.1 shikimate kinase [Jeotgalicoccus coquinae]GGE12402.1 shikimate kinase [Jeotgalicoccus coquinae]CAD2073772.1 Shikimate kinase [Jeotgalicoccus coquinae]
MILIGFMGCGKTTIANELGRKLNKEVIDLDAVIPAIAGRTIPEIFADEGEAAFREYEYRALKETLQKDVIIATGGGVVTYDKSYDELKGLSGRPVFFLNAPFEDLYKRIQQDENRPLGNQDSEKVRELYNSRLDKYTSLASREVSTLQTVEKTAAEIIVYMDESNL